MIKMTPSCFDVAIVGGGPGGSATAVSLRMRFPTLSVVLIEASHYDLTRVGETMPPPARPILEHLGVWQAFLAQRHREVYGTAAAWGSATTLDNDFFYMPANIGWHLDRAAFDCMLASQAESRGASLVLDTRVYQARRARGQWQLTLSTGADISARFIVDAAGGNAALARNCGARFVDADRLVGIARFFDGGAEDPRTMVETFSDGWWYTAGLPNGRRITTCMTDADLARRLGLRQTDEWTKRLATMSHVQAIVGEGKPCSPLVVRSAASRRLEPVADGDWLAVGDSASRFDPLSSQGIVKALRSGVFASYAIGDLLTRSDDTGLSRYRRYVRDEFESYVEVRAKYYRQEQRWPTNEFWRRRHDTIGNHRDVGTTACSG